MKGDGYHIIAHLLLVPKSFAEHVDAWYTETIIFMLWKHVKSR